MRTWLVWGEKDTLVPTGGVGSWLEGLRAPEGAIRSASAHPAAWGHSPQLEKPAVTAAVLSQILLGRVPHAKGTRWWRVLESRAS